MPFSLAEYERKRPYLYHHTARQNLQRLRHLLRLDCAAILLDAGGLSHLLKVKRRGPTEVQVGRYRVQIRDQDPLYEGNMSLQGGWSFADLIHHLNQHVFFWSGTETGPVTYGQRHFGRYRDETPVFLRATFAELLSLNPAAEPLFCKYNSGAPRCSKGKGSPRGPETFATASQTTFNLGSVVEVAFRNAVMLPATTQCADKLNGRWSPL